LTSGTRTTISSESLWSALAAGTLAGIGGWYLHLDKALSSAHPKQALFWTTVGVTLSVQFVVEYRVRKREGQLQE
jgi:hypothetical protein